MDRRQFNSLCTSLLAGASSVHATAGSHQSAYPASRLRYEDDSDVTVESLVRGRSYVFGYPYVTTPCFLIRLDSSAPGSGSWPGGVGPDRSIVAFSAICSHKMTHPARPISHIAYRTQSVRFYDKAGREHSREGVISCCSERSIYDPARGAEVLSGPAPLPLAAIALDEDPMGRLSAVGSIGEDLYDRFLDKFGFRLAMEYGVNDARVLAGERAVVVPAEEYSRQQVLC